MRKLFYSFMAMAVTLVAFTSCKSTAESEQAVHIDFEEYTLPNGLKVILHEDHSDPIVAQAIAFHVGSAREKEGKTGFAHFFEHMLFQRSEHLPRNAFFNKIADMGGTFNGGTGNDMTTYFECVPRNALEKILWMESDRMGFFINTVTQSGLEREIDVICNEKRQTEVNNAFVRIRRGASHSRPLMIQSPDSFGIAFSPNNLQYLSSCHRNHSLDGLLSHFYLSQSHCRHKTDISSLLLFPV